MCVEDNCLPELTLLDTAWEEVLLVHGLCIDSPIHDLDTSAKILTHVK